MLRASSSTAVLDIFCLLRFLPSTRLLNTLPRDVYSSTSTSSSSPSSLLAHEGPPAFFSRYTSR